MDANLMGQVIQATGIVVGSLTAVCVLIKNRRNQQADLASRREVFHSILRMSLSDCVKQLKALEHEVTKFPDSHVRWARSPHHLRLRALKRLLDLQIISVTVGDAADAKVAKFIEECRNYHRIWRQFKISAEHYCENKDGFAVDDEGEITGGALALRDTIIELAPLGQQALHEITRN